MTENRTDTSTVCPSLGTLRSHLDHDDPHVGAHLDGCRECRETIVTLADRAGTARRLLGTLDEDAATLDDDAAPAPAPRRRPSRPMVAPDGRHESLRPGPPRRRLRDRLALAGAAAAIALLAATVGQPVIAQVLDSLRSERVQPVVVDPGTVGDQLAGLEAFADVTEIVGDTLAGDLDDLDAAATLARVPAPDPAGIADAVSPRVHATSRVGVHVAFRSTPQTPERLRGVVLEIVAPGVLVVGDADGGVVVATARAVEVTATGASLDEVRDTLLTEVELPPTLRDQLAAMDDWRTTLPVPVPVDASLWDEVDVHGVPGLAIGHGDHFGAVVWQEGDLVHAVGGERSVEQLLDLAGRL